MTTDLRTEFFDFLGRAVFCGDCSGAESFSEEIKYHRLEALVYYLSRGKEKEYSLYYTARSGKSLVQESGVKQLKTLLEKENIPFCFIKGADLAYRIYPESALRIFSDWDVFVPQSRLKEFCRVLEKDNWRCRLDSFCGHHAGMRSKGKYCLEPHFSLPNFEYASPEELWKECIKKENTNCEYILPPELDLIMLLQHNSTAQFQRGNCIKLLCDIAFLIKKEKIDWKKTDALRRKYRTCHPGLLWQAFPEFFRYAPTTPDCRFKSDAAAASRDLAVNSHYLGDQTQLERMTARWNSWKYWRLKLRNFSKDNLCWKYHLPADCGAVIHWYRLKDIWLKITYFLHRRDLNVPVEYVEHVRKMQLVENAEPEQDISGKSVF